MRKTRYKLGVDAWGLVLFMLVMLPNFIWFAVPAPEDVLRKDSATPVVDVIASVLQVLTVVCLCLIFKQERHRLWFSPLVVTTMACLIVYYVGWIMYYTGYTNAVVILMLTIPPCLSFILFAVDRKNLPATMFATGFTVFHLLFAIVNFIIQKMKEDERRTW